LMSFHQSPSGHILSEVLAAIAELPLNPFTLHAGKKTGRS
jgi:hypothetical protein